MSDNSSRATRPMIDERVHASVLGEKRHWQTIAERMEPLPMLLFCPACGQQHVDAPEPDNDWANPPHRSHRCSACGCIWRPADFPTTGIAAIRTRGKVDTWTAGDAVVPAAHEATTGDGRKDDEAVQQGHRHGHRPRLSVDVARAKRTVRDPAQLNKALAPAHAERGSA